MVKFKNSQNKIATGGSITTKVTKNDKGKFNASGQFNGKIYKGEGQSAREATLDLRAKFEKDISEHKLVIRN